jgi:hypothetical protein
MAFKGRTIYYSSWNEGLKMLNLSDESVSYLINSYMSGVYYVATFGDKPLGSLDHLRQTILVYDVVHQER